MHKFQRNYRCEFTIGKQAVDGTRTPEHKITVSYPTTIQFTINRSAHSDCNTAQIKFFNIKKEHQALLWRNFYQTSKYVEIDLYAGYGDTMPQIFKGLAQQCISYRPSGGTEYITEIQANDMSYLFQYGFCNATVSKDTNAQSLFETLLQGVKDIQVGYVSKDIEPLKKDTTYFGQPMDVLTRDYSKYQIFVDNGNLHVLSEKDIIPSQNYVITANSGLLGSPIRSERTIELDMIFEPGLKIGQAVKLLSDSVENINGTYKVIAMSHQGVISPVVSDKLTTHLSLLTEIEAFQELSKGSDYTELKVSGKGWLKPVNYSINSPYGWRTHPIYKDRRFHSGIDFACGMNTQVKATQKGIVSFTGYINGYGYTVKINHGKVNGNEVVSQYSHLNKYQVTPGQRVEIGQAIALSGSSGNVTGPHLHFEIHENGKTTDPLNYIGGK